VTEGILDSSILVDILARHPQSLAWFNTIKHQQLAIHPIVWIEVVRGSRNRSEQAKIVGFLLQFTIEHPMPDDNDWAMRQFSHFSLSGGVGWEDV
jgi:predicted nucleic acid-binding protein